MRLIRAVKSKTPKERVYYSKIWNVCVISRPQVRLNQVTEWIRTRKERSSEIAVHRKGYNKKEIH